MVAQVETGMDRDARGARLFSLLAMASALGMYLLLQGIAWMRAGGVFEYPLDDVYIHLAMAEEIARGGYGVNAGEYASADSSLLYPLLLAPFAGTSLHRYLPIFWNVIGLLGTAFMWGRILWRAGYGEGALRPLGLILAFTGPLVLNVAGVAFTGMEHSLHAFLVLVALYGLQTFLESGRVPLWLVASLILGVMLRYEGLGVSFAIALVIALKGRWRAGLALFAASLLPLIAFGFFLHALGLEPVPNSVMSKLADLSEAHMPLADRMVRAVLRNMARVQGMSFLILVLAFAISLLWPRMWRAWNGRYWPFALALVIVGAGHLMFGKFGYMNRYEHYVLLFGYGAALCAIRPMLADLIAPDPARSMWHKAGKLIMPAFVVWTGASIGQYYIPVVLQDVTLAPSQIHRQQGQMARFQREYVKGPVAVNDLGWVSYRNDDYVLDLWGLASLEALKIRLREDVPEGWAGPLVKARGVKLVMIYDKWLGEAVGPEWIYLGTLGLGEKTHYLGGNEVDFYAPDAASAAPLQEALEAFVPTMPKGAHFRFADGRRMDGQGASPAASLPSAGAGETGGEGVRDD